MKTAGFVYRSDVVILPRFAYRLSAHAFGDVGRQSQDARISPRASTRTVCTNKHKAAAAFSAFLVQ